MKTSSGVASWKVLAALAARSGTRHGLAASLLALGSCTFAVEEQPGPGPATQRQFASTVTSPGVSPVDLSEYVRKPTYVAVFPRPDADPRAEVQGNGSRELVENVAQALYRAVVETARLLDMPIRGAAVLHLVALQELPKSYRFTVTYSEGDEGMNYLFESAFFYLEGDDPWGGPGALRLQDEVFHSFPHELSHRLCQTSFSYSRVRLPFDAESRPTHAPRWLDDGVAEFVARRVQSALAPTLPPARSTQTGRTVLRRLGASFLDWPDASDADWMGVSASDHYAAALVLVEALFDSDVEKLRCVLRDLRSVRCRTHQDLRTFLKNELRRDPYDVATQF